MSGSHQSDSNFLSVCIPAFNDEIAFSRCIESVCSQTIENIEIVVSDDSHADTIERAVKKRNDARIRYKRNTPSLGAPANWNAALRMSRGNIVTLLHQDDWYRTPDTLTVVCNAMDANASDIIITGRALYQEHHCLGEYRLPNNAAKRFLSDFPGKSLVINRLGHPSVFFFKGRFRNILYDESLLYFSDTDYYNRLITAANKVTIHSDSLVAISWKKTNRLSNAFLSDPLKTLTELFLVHNKYKCSPFVRGMSTARLCASNIRHWYPSIGSILRFIRPRMPYSAFFATCVSMPFFLLFMVYRLAYRAAQNKGWG